MCYDLGLFLCFCWACVMHGHIRVLRKVVFVYAVKLYFKKILKIFFKKNYVFVVLDCMLYQNKF